MRKGCAGMTANDGVTGDYSYLSVDTSPDGANAPGTPQGTGLYGGK
jgi:hypothetical protein